MPIGKSRFGFFTSSAADDTESKPINAKNITAAAPNTPFQPLGMNGCQFAGVTWNTPTPITISTTATLIATITLFTRADSLIPIDSSDVIAIMTRNAGRLNSVKCPGTAPGAAVSATGNEMPKPDSSDCRYPDQPTDTAEVANPYSSIRSQPITHAASSPSVAYEYV